MPSLPRGWQGGWGEAGQSLRQPSGLSTHGLLMGLSYRLLYILVSLGRLLHALLRGRHSHALALAYALAFGLSLALLLLRQPTAAVQGHRLLNLISSPLDLLVLPLYGLMLLGRRTRPPVAGSSRSGATW